jgi:hypothetical protein
VKDFKPCHKLDRKEDLKIFSKIIININNSNMKTQIRIKDSTEKDTTIREAKEIEVTIKHIIIKANNPRT